MGKPSIVKQCYPNFFWEGNLGKWNISVPKGKEKKFRIIAKRILLVAASEKGIVQTYFIFSLLNIDRGCKVITFQSISFEGSLLI